MQMSLRNIQRPEATLNIGRWRAPFHRDCTPAFQNLQSAENRRHEYFSKHATDPAAAGDPVVRNSFSCLDTVRELKHSQQD